MSSNGRILLLDNRLANQIAAGEVVERPASVVKELLENSIDSGASRIEVDIERGGTRLIRVIDNGKGIHKDDLALALTRHATSKIKTTNDLMNINSLGFRGEALASISSVSRLTLTSRLHDSELAWQAVAQGRDMAVDILPAAASQGTRIEVADLFFNTPARQKFLRTEKTEFSHIEEVFKSHALANFEIAFVLKHNHKVVKRVPACGDGIQQIKRIATICGKSFAENAIAFECSHELVQISGWLGKPDFHRSESDIQYVYINHRPVKDKTLNHAIRQAYEGLLPAGRMSTYVIFLSVDPSQVDVNVHPTKHEVRFGEQRLIHDLLAKSIREALSDFPLLVNATEKTNIEFGSDVNQQHYALAQATNIENENAAQENILNRAGILNQESSLNANLLAKAQSEPLAETSVQNSQNYAKTIENKRQMPQYQRASLDHVRHYSLNAAKEFSQSQVQEKSVDQRAFTSSREYAAFHLDQNLWFIKINQQVLVIDSHILLQEYIECLLSEKKQPASIALLFPKKLSLPSELLEDYSTHQLLERLGFVCSSSEGTNIEIRKTPVWLSSVDTQMIFTLLSGWLTEAIKSENEWQKIAKVIASSLDELSNSLLDWLLTAMKETLTQSNASREIDSEQIKALFL
ncbi:DNA mismatch repair endonuclease MutL [Aliikangiella sp. IMCC44359]|uniref:DNA mismatch repair endonuclease MutL n=1 Tax=Aliikangiella sp. IMCC44359 TaxID=3459125 RepID=UPI00403AFD12